jgi:predicted O-methyltransferase YrrM
MEHFYTEIIGYSTMVDQGELLKTILKILPKNNLKIAEIGVFNGRCTAMWNVELINSGVTYEYYAIDHFLGSKEHDKTIDYYGITLDNLKSIKDSVNIIKNTSVEESKNHPDEFFDIVYLDASHDYKSVKEDIIAWLPKVKPFGVICGDDYILGWPEVMKAVNEVFKGKINVVGHQQWWTVKNIL